MLRAAEKATADLQNAQPELTSFAHQLQVVPRSTLHAILNGKRLPSEAALRTLLRLPRLDPPPDEDLWMNALRRLRVDEPERATLFVREADPIKLGVHPPIESSAGVGGALPQYVARDADGGPDGIRAKMAELAERGGFLLITGNSAAGKTRSAYEAVLEIVPDWRLEAPLDSESLGALIGAIQTDTVLWLDELGLFLNTDDGATAALLRLLVDGVPRVIVVGTLWSQRYAKITADAANDPAKWVQGRLLDLAMVLPMADVFSDDERDRAEEYAQQDDRIAAALRSEDYGATQVLAAAPQLMARWRHAEEVDRALMDAAIDLARFGGPRSLTVEMLRALTPLYCSERTRGRARTSWLADALAYATAKLKGATATLEPIAEHIGNVSRYVVADYLLQAADRARRHLMPPEPVWCCYVAHLTDAVDLVELAETAEYRGLVLVAEQLLRKAAPDSQIARSSLGRILEQQERWFELSGLRRWKVAALDKDACHDLAVFLFKFERDAEALDALRLGVERDEECSCLLLAQRLEAAGKLEEATETLRRAARDGGETANSALAELLERRGDYEAARNLFIFLANRYQQWDELFAYLKRRGQAIKAAYLRTQLVAQNPSLRLAPLAGPVTPKYSPHQRFWWEARDVRSGELIHTGPIIDDEGLPVLPRHRDGTGTVFRYRTQDGNPDGIFGCPLLMGISIQACFAHISDKPMLMEVVREVYVEPELRERLQAVDTTEKAIEILRALPRQNAWTRNGIARMVAHTGEIDGGVALARKAIERGDTLATNLLGFIYDAAGDRAAATTAWASVILRGGGFHWQTQTRFGNLIESDADLNARFRKYGLTFAGEVAGPGAADERRYGSELIALSTSFEAAQSGEDREAIVAAVEQKLTELWAWYEAVGTDFHPLDFVYLSRGVARVQRNWNLLPQYGRTMITMIQRLRGYYPMAPGPTRELFVELLSQLIRVCRKQQETKGLIDELMPDLHLLLADDQLALGERATLAEAALMIGETWAQASRYVEAHDALDLAACQHERCPESDIFASLRARSLGVQVWMVMATADAGYSGLETAWREIITLVDNLTDDEERTKCTGALCLGLIDGGQLAETAEEASKLLERCRALLGSPLAVLSEIERLALHTAATVQLAKVMIEIGDLAVAERLLAEARAEAPDGVEVPDLQDLLDAE